MTDSKGQTVAVAEMPATQGTSMDGILVVNKPSGWTSHDVVAKIRSSLGRVKVGHAGTLDPAATGVLPVLVGRGTRIAEYLLGWDKEYQAVLRLGATTDTQDATGTVLSRNAVHGLTEERIRETAARFIGASMQIPPMYSAVKVAGVPLYKSARAGRTIAREPRTVRVSILDVLGIRAADVDLRIVCSKGTYVRTLCADIGEALGVGGHLFSLERRRVGPFHLEQALTMEEVVSLAAAGSLTDRLISLDRALLSLPAVTVNQATALRVFHGVPVPSEGVLGWENGEDSGRLPAGRPVRIKNQQGHVLAIGLLSGESDGGFAACARTEPIRITKVLVHEDMQRPG